jgi:hypothetical protein
MPAKTIEIINVLYDKPEKGDVVAVLTPEEIVEFNDLGDTLAAMEQANDVKLSHAKEIAVAYREWWNNFFTKNEVNSAWPVKLDTLTGYVYICE